MIGIIPPSTTMWGSTQNWGERGASQYFQSLEITKHFPHAESFETTRKPHYYHRVSRNNETFQNTIIDFSDMFAEEKERKERQKCYKIYYVEERNRQRVKRRKEKAKWKGKKGKLKIENKMK